MTRLFKDSSIEPITFAQDMGYTIHENFLVDDLSTYPEMIESANQYRKDTGTLCDYPCWIPEAGMVRINPERLQLYYDKMTS